MLDFKKEEQRGARNKIIDIKYIITPNPGFVGDVKAANKRQLEAKTSLSAAHKARQNRAG